MLRYLRRKWYRRHAPKEADRLPLGGVKWTHHVAVNLETREPISEWWSRDRELPLRFERHIKIHPRGTPTAQ